MTAMAGYGIFFGSMMIKLIGNQTVPIESTPKYFTFLLNHSVQIATLAVVIGLVVSTVKSQFACPVILTILLAYFSPLAVPLSDGPVSLSHENGFEFGLFLFYAGAPMAVLIVLTCLSWYHAIRKSRSLTSR